MLGTVAAVVWTGSLEPAMYLVLPTFYGRWLLVLYGTTQHAGLAEDVLDHRLNTRTVYMNRLNRFCYLNMNYHVEHHMFPNVPYHALPALHEAVKSDMPPPYPSIAAAYREIIPALRRQRRDPSYYVTRPLPGVST
jgi:fatty acid desaturase